LTVHVGEPAVRTEMRVKLIKFESTCFQLCKFAIPVACSREQSYHYAEKMFIAEEKFVRKHAEQEKCEIIIY
jgi:hypothetical protein